MFVVKLVYGIEADGHTESCVGFDSLDEAREFALEAVIEICDKVGNGSQADNAILRIWDADADGELITDICEGGIQK
jgi:hypothetical protein|uniref:Uncharacterized protein n=1 Tax=Siphoviridae sp. ctcK97 TaxID=2825571 RepID=A0A8S5UAV0_9CAUD|nr:MAG TPA: hypothetical protein [Siphoviridae sp. ctcK97]